MHPLRAYYVALTTIGTTPHLRPHEVNQWQAVPHSAADIGMLRYFVEKGLKQRRIRRDT
jgi:hypothetical protein